ncbi:MAG: B12-binding domain-containing radical SAM protein [Methanomassiliicoccales archaeon]|nr:MAG: B12-binding domain-containing radical SAM protein [Methanomassiliicoccales archaeon]
MKITMICPRVIDAPLPPLGILYIAAVLEKEGHKLQVFDVSPDERIKVIEEIAKFKPDLIGLSVSSTQLNHAKEISNMLRKVLPETPIVCGGVHVTALPVETLMELNADFAIIGEGEYSMLELCKKLETGGSLDEVGSLVHKKGDKIVQNKRRGLIEDLNELPFPARHLLDFEWYLIPPGPIRGIWLKRATTLITSRGCPYSCIYCGSNLIFGRKVRRRSIENVIAEIEELKEKYNIDGMWFLDDTFTLNKKWVVDFCNNLRKNKIELVWGCQARANTIQEDVLIEMKKAGCAQLDVGVESGSERILKVLQKKTNPKMIEDAFSMAKKVGLRTMASFMLGNPEETMDDINKTLELAKKIDPDFTLFFFTTPFPGTKLNEMAIENKWIKDEDYSKWLVKQTDSPIMEINFTAEELIEIRSTLQNEFVFKNYISTLRNPSYILNFLLLLTRYPRGIVKGAGKAIKSKRVDDIIYSILEEYRSRKRTESI